MWKTSVAQMCFFAQSEYFTFQLLSLHKRLSWQITDNLGKNLHHWTYESLNHEFWLDILKLKVGHRSRSGCGSKSLTGRLCWCPDPRSWCRLVARKGQSIGSQRPRWKGTVHWARRPGPAGTEGCRDTASGMGRSSEREDYILTANFIHTFLGGHICL